MKITEISIFERPSPSLRAVRVRNEHQSAAIQEFINYLTEKFGITKEVVEGEFDGKELIKLGSPVKLKAGCLRLADKIYATEDI